MPWRAAEGAALSAASRELQECVGDGLRFERGLATLTAEGLQRALAVAEVLKRYPQVGAKVLGYTHLPSHGMSAEDLGELALARAGTVQQLLSEAGCPNRVSVQSLGGGGGPRCEVHACEARELREVAAASRRLSRQLTRRRSVASLPVAFEREGRGGVRTVVFRRRPLGLSFGGGTVLCVAFVEPGGQAEALGVEEGWTLHTVAGEGVADKDPAEAAALLSRLSRELPRASSP